MYVHRAVVPHILIAPHHVQQILPAVHPARVAHEQLHQVELLGRQLHWGPVLPGRALRRVQMDVAHGQLPRLLLLDSGGGGTAEQGPHPGLQLQNVEGLGHIVVRSAGKAHQLVRILPLGSEHDDGHVGKLPDAHTGLQPVDLGHHQVQDNEVKAALPGQLHRLLPVGARFHLIALLLQVKADALHQHRLVIHH